MSAPPDNKFIEVARRRSTADLQMSLSLWKKMKPDLENRSEIIEALTWVLVEERGNPPPLWGRFG